MSIQPNKYNPPDPRRLYNEINKARAQLSEATRGRSSWESWRQTVIVFSFLVTLSFTFLWRTHRLQATMDSIVEQRDFMASFIPGKGHIAATPVVALAAKPEEEVALPLPTAVLAAVPTTTSPPASVPLPVPVPPPAAREPAAAVAPVPQAPTAVAAPLTAQSPPSNYRQLKVMPAAYAADKAEFPDVP